MYTFLKSVKYENIAKRNRGKRKFAAVILK